MEEKYNVSIPEPCHEDWDKMKPAEQGRFCQSCCKVVVDFTSKTTNEIVDYLLAAGKKSVCGRAYDEQLSLVPVRKSPKSRFRLFTAALYFVFGSLLFSSCSVFRHHRRTHATGGKFMLEPKNNSEKPNPLLNPRENR
jgi:hypothetical protein